MSRTPVSRNRATTVSEKPIVNAAVTAPTVSGNTTAAVMRAPPRPGGASGCGVAGAVR
jgi:hypothetical protein